jgi:glycosyltransferase involved in cell wall biosynthesis
VNVLLANKFFYRRAGAETVFFDTLDLLEARGHAVAPFAMRSDRNVATDWSRYFVREREYHGGGLVSRGRDAAASIYSLEARRNLRELLRAFRPDVAHLHNVYHQLTLSIVDELAAAEVPIVLTVHDYKPVCPNYTMFTEGEICDRCLSGAFRHAVIHRCLHDSRAASAVAALEATIARRRRTYDKVGRFVAPSAFLKRALVAGGIDEARVDVVRNPVALPASARGATGPMFLFLGRLTVEKGVRTLLAAATSLQATGARIVVCGEGPLEEEVRAAARRLPAAVEFRGFVSKPEAEALLREARAVLFPSIWNENGPMALLEAAAWGVPSIASDIGGVPELVLDGETGLTVPPGDATALAAAIDRLAADEQLASSLGASARAAAASRHDPGAYLGELLALYGRVGAG